MTRMRIAAVTGVVLAVLAQPGEAQRPDETTVFDSIAVEGAVRLGRDAVVSRAAVPLGQPVGFLDIQRAIQALYATAQFESVDVLQGTVDGKEVLLFRVVERPLLLRWDVEGTDRLPERSVRGRVRMVSGRPYNPAEAAAAIAGIDSLYKQEGYYQTQVTVEELPQPDGSVQVLFSVDEGSRVAVSRVIIEGNEAFDPGEIVSHMGTSPEGFWWFKDGEYDEDVLRRDIRERLPEFYASRGYIDFQVLRDTLVIEDGTGKGVLILSVDEGQQYHVGTFEVVGNREYTAEQLETFYPFRDPEEGSGFLGTGGGREADVFDRTAWESATQDLNTLYSNNGYIYAQIRENASRRTGPAGEPLVDLRWQIIEGSPAIVNKINIIGNTITHESVVRRAILMVPGDVFRQNALIQSYQNLSNLGFFEQPVPVPQVNTVNQQGDVDITFEVEERRTGNVNFGASVGQGTGIGGFLGLDEPNLFGKGKRIQFQLQFGANLSDFNVTYTDPSLRGSFVSGTVRLHNTRQRFTVADLGRITSRGASVQLGFPLFGSRFTRVLTSYQLEQSDFGSQQILRAFTCTNCILSSVAVSLVRDTRIGLPFATGGTLHQFQISQNGGFLGGSGNFRRATFEGRWYAPLSSGSLDGFGGGGPEFVLGFTSKMGFVWGDAGPHFRQLFSLGGTQFGIPLRGYDEFSITPDGYDARATGSTASSVGAFGGAYVALTGEIGLRLSQALYFSTFMDAGNVWDEPSQFNPTRLFRGAGVGVNLLSPLGPIGLDYAYGFDRTDLDGNPDPAWQFHFRLGQFF